MSEPTTKPDYKPKYNLRYTFPGECEYERQTGKSAERVRRKFLKAIGAWFSKDGEAQYNKDDLIGNPDIQELAFICMFHQKGHPKKIEEVDLPPTNKGREVFKSELVLAIMQDLHNRLEKEEDEEEDE